MKARCSTCKDWKEGYTAYVGRECPSNYGTCGRGPDFSLYAPEFHRDFGCRFWESNPKDEFMQCGRQKMVDGGRERSPDEERKMLQLRRLGQCQVQIWCRWALALFEERASCPGEFKGALEIVADSHFGGFGPTLQGMVDDFVDRAMKILDGEGLREDIAAVLKDAKKNYKGLDYVAPGVLDRVALGVADEILRMVDES